jgi:uncharacterized protein (TIGR04255 family)
MGVQFAPPRGYQQIYAREVWELFRKEFPKVQELPPLPPSFETFGRPQSARINFGIVTGASHNRFWFISENEDELIQFQNNRLLHNWRKVGGRTNPYPRFENIFPKFEAEISKLERYFTNFSYEPLNINQCELTYLNHILLTEEDSTSIDKWIRLINLETFALEDFTLIFRKIIRDEGGNPCGRLICESHTAINDKEEPLILLTLIVRGAPKEPNISSALDFLRDGRETIVNCFDEITTEFAHEKWGKE